MGSEEYVIFWFRRDLRLNDNHGLYKALTCGLPVQPLFIFDSEILDELPANDLRVSVIYDAIKQIHTTLKKQGSSLRIAYGDPVHIIQKIFNQHKPQAIYTNEDYEPYAQTRDKTISKLAEKNQVLFHLFKDQVITAPYEILKKDHTPYTVFTPWSKKWFAHFTPNKLDTYSSKAHLNNFCNSHYKLPDLKTIGFTHKKVLIPKQLPAQEQLTKYKQERDIPASNATTRIGVALRFGLISIRSLIKHAANYPVYLNELAWREFYMMIIYYFPDVVKNAFKKQYDRIQWRNNELEFEIWKNGQTGYPMVDAGMRELRETGYMHNRVRMVTASFLTKHLLIDWRWGEAWFARLLLDYELSSNNGGWQWAAGTGCDAAPYFRVFNPTLQAQKFDPKQNYIKKWIPELNTLDYPGPIVNHKMARQRALERYKAALGK